MKYAIFLLLPITSLTLFFKAKTEATSLEEVVKSLKKLEASIRLELSQFNLRTQRRLAWCSSVEGYFDNLARMKKGDYRNLEKAMIAFCSKFEHLSRVQGDILEVRAQVLRNGSIAALADVAPRKGKGSVTRDFFGVSFLQLNQPHRDWCNRFLALNLDHQKTLEAEEASEKESILLNKRRQRSDDERRDKIGTQKRNLETLIATISNKFSLRSSEDVRRSSISQKIVDQAIRILKSIGSPTAVPVIQNLQSVNFFDGKRAWEEPAIMVKLREKVVETSSEVERALGEELMSLRASGAEKEQDVVESLQNISNIEDEKTETSSYISDLDRECRDHVAAVEEVNAALHGMKEESSSFPRNIL